jgi:hypothetical protein
MATKEGVGDWVLIKLIDYEDSAWNCEHVHRHPYGREAVVGPGGSWFSVFLEAPSKSGKMRMSISRST